MLSIESHLARIDRRVGQAIRDVETGLPQTPGHLEPSVIWGVAFSPLTLEQTLYQIDQLVQARKPHYFVTANVNYAMLTSQDHRLGKVNDGAAFVLADGMPIVWRSRWSGRRIPERVAGSDLIYAISHWSAYRGYRIFFLGGAPGVARRASQRLQERYSQLEIAGVASPPFRQLAPREQTELMERVRTARPDILFVALGQPKGEFWLAEHCEELQVPMSVQLGASFDFVAGTATRSPTWIQQLGMEWLYRLVREPARLGPRYGRNAAFLVSAVLRDSWRAVLP